MTSSATPPSVPLFADSHEPMLPAPLLIVEDDRLTQRRLRAILTSLGYHDETLHFAGSIAAAEALLADQPFAMVLADVGLPDGNGIDLIRALHGRDPALPILVISAWSTEQIIVTALQAGATGYLLKERDDIEIALSIRSALPDVWTARWPTFDGVVWYRLRWQQASDAPERALLIDYLNMAGAVYLNGMLMRSDASLVEPLTRAWNSPRYLRLPPPLLHPGENVLLVRVSGLAAYQPGLGAMTIGDPVALGHAYAHARTMRYDLQLVSLAVTATLGCFFLSLWLMRPGESAYGWFSVMSLAWWWVALNQVATSTWPFAGTHGWERANLAALLVYTAAFTMFIVRYSERRLPRIERTLWALVPLGVLALALVPESGVGVARSALTIAQAVVFFMTCGVFVVFAWRHGRADQRVVAASVAVFLRQACTICSRSSACSTTTCTTAH